jgi:hypothetical protein
MGASGYPKRVYVLAGDRDEGFDGEVSDRLSKLSLELDDQVPVGVYELVKVVTVKTPIVMDGE